LKTEKEQPFVTNSDKPKYFELAWKLKNINLDSRFAAFKEGDAALEK
jgi:hypothetical protein